MPHWIVDGHVPCACSLRGPEPGMSGHCRPPSPSTELWQTGVDGKEPEPGSLWLCPAGLAGHLMNPADPARPHPSGVCLLSGGAASQPCSVVRGSLRVTEATVIPQKGCSTLRLGARALRARVPHPQLTCSRREQASGSYRAALGSRDHGQRNSCPPCEAGLASLTPAPWYVVYEARRRSSECHDS